MCGDGIGQYLRFVWRLGVANIKIGILMDISTAFFTRTSIFGDEGRFRFR